jgi:regulator of protease activity HflC (stomatin/prohibitin superfamily)
LGDPPPEGEFLVDGEIGEANRKGPMRRVLSPGRYRINPYGYGVSLVKTVINNSGKTKKHSGWVQIPTGYVGVVTNKTNNPLNGQKSGTQDKVLPPGIYPINGAEQEIDIVEIGFRECSVAIQGEGTHEIDEHGEPNADKLKGGISFPSSDGFTIMTDFTSIWGLTPAQAPNAIRNFGDVSLVENKVVLPQIESICRNHGSECSAVDLLVGKKREEFQNGTLDEFHKVLAEKDISVLYGLVKHIYIPKEVRKPIQMAFIADELKITREQEQKTARSESELREAERRVELESKTVEAETKKLVAERNANGRKVVGETEAETRKIIATIEKQTAELQSQAKLVIAQAENEGKTLIEQAKANRFKLAVQAFGTPTAYNNWMFASSLPESIELRFLYAGPGTLWTDLKDSIKVMVPPVQNTKEEKRP